MAGSTVLVVDDEPRIVEFLRENLRDDDFSVLTAATGAEAIELLGRARPDVILLDVVLPDMSGYEICRTIRAGDGINPVGSPPPDHHALGQGRLRRPRPRPTARRGRLRDQAVSGVCRESTSEVGSRHSIQNHVAAQALKRPNVAEHALTHEAKPVEQPDHRGVLDVRP
jgi:CheY-like chemotaxis protein